MSKEAIPGKPRKAFNSNAIMAIERCRYFSSLYDELKNPLVNHEGTLHAQSP
jgi:hypothetical protein